MGLYDSSFEAYLTMANWKHVKTGVVYKIVMFANREEDLAPLVVYRRAVGQDPIEPVWVRPAAAFFDGRFIRLFPGYSPSAEKPAKVPDVA